MRLPLQPLSQFFDLEACEVSLVTQEKTAGGSARRRRAGYRHLRSPGEESAGPASKKGMPR